ncbi:DNA helicase RecD [Carbonactinospora thermoautotrophica]|uniref:AAA family ATPase n=1 Tax=Carbonactinospora thermoautotrophica TaxID=1469144 RepID=UPI00226ECF5C|nr:AAA family ATPase [Carbonactinospora thermoautotrophica]MCX9192777.1 DNA helicase RecD [Carbonactinospora thermoautotrophica]
MVAQDVIEATARVLDGAPPALADLAVAHLGEAAPGLLREDPWALLAVPGVRPEQADAFARAQLGPAARPGDPRRGRGLVAWLLERAALDGHTVVPARKVRAALAGCGVPDPAAAVATALEDGRVLEFTLPEAALPEQVGDAPGDAAGAEQADERLLALDRYAMAEDTVAESVARLLATAEPWPGGLPGRIGSGAPARLTDAMAGHGVVLARYAGRYGELVRAVGALAQAAAVPAALITPTAAQEPLDGLSDACVPWSLRRWFAERAGGLRDAASEPRVIVLVEAHALDVATAGALLESTPDGCRVVLAGDPDQLPACGPGRAFGDLVESGACPVVDLDGPGDGCATPLARLAAGVRAGELPRVEDPQRRLVVVPARHAGEAVHRVVQLVTDSIPRALGIPSDQVQVLTPRHRGLAGTRGLNAALRDALRSGDPAGPAPGPSVGDQVVVTRTLPGAGLVAGETGVVTLRDEAGLVVQFADGSVEVRGALVRQALRPGWAISVPRATGSCWPAAVAVLPGEAAGSLSRALVLTAFTRGVRHLSVVHAAGRALAHAVAREEGRRRLTRLRHLLRAEYGL